MRIEGHAAGQLVVDDDADATAVLRAAGCRVTRPRVAVLQALLDHGGPLDAAQMTTLAQDVEPGIHEATVYRTIGVLADVGIVSHVHAGHGPSLVRLSNREAVVAVCRECGAIESLPVVAVDHLVATIEAGSGFSLELGHFALEGVCGQCLADAN